MKIVYTKESFNSKFVDLQKIYLYFESYVASLNILSRFKFQIHKFDENLGRNKNKI